MKENLLKHKNNQNQILYIFKYLRQTFAECKTHCTSSVAIAYEVIPQQLNFNSTSYDNGRKDIPE